MTPTPEQLAHRHEVADWIEANPTGFDMAFYGVMGECGAVMCIAGVSATLTGEAEWDSDGFMEWAKVVASKAMGFAWDDAGALFVDLGIPAAESMPEHLRAKGMAQAVRYTCEMSVSDALDRAVAEYGT